MKLLEQQKSEVSIGKIRNMVTQGAGLKKFAKELFGIEFSPQVETFKVEKGTTFLIVSDGVSDNLTDAQIQKAMKESGKQPARLSEDVVKKSVLTALDEENNSRAKHDDMTAVAVRCS